MKLRSEQRKPTYEVGCPACARVIRFYRFSGMGDCFPHFYCDTCSNVFHRPSDYDRVRLGGESEQLLHDLKRDLPGCPCGGQFRPGADPKCPHCGFEMRHQMSPVQRLSDSYAILVAGSSMLMPEP